MLYLTKLEEERDVVVDRIQEHQSHLKKLFDKKAKQRVLQDGDLFLVWDNHRESNGLHGKIDSLWRGPFHIKEVCEKNSFIFSYLGGIQLPFLYNGKHLKHYYQQKVQYTFLYISCFIFGVLLSVCVVFCFSSCCLIFGVHSLFWKLVPQVTPLYSLMAKVLFQLFQI